MALQKINVAIAGLGFGKEFIPIYQCHPSTQMYAICERTRERLDTVGDEFGVGKRFTCFEELIEDPAVDAVHINTPIHFTLPRVSRLCGRVNTLPAQSQRRPRLRSARPSLKRHRDRARAT